MIFPNEITVDRAQKKLFIQWPDGVKSDYSFAYLRNACPCAHCDTTKHGGEPVERDEKQFEAISVRDAEQVGHYAIRFLWSDGHDSGIYSYEFLRELGGHK